MEVVTYSAKRDPIQIHLKQHKSILSSIPSCKKFQMFFLKSCMGFLPNVIWCYLLNQRPYKFPYSMPMLEFHQLQMHMKNFLDLELIQPSMSPWGTPIIFVRKKGNPTMQIISKLGLACYFLSTFRLPRLLLVFFPSYSHRTPHTQGNITKLYGHQKNL